MVRATHFSSAGPVSRNVGGVAISKMLQPLECFKKETCALVNGTMHCLAS